MADLEVNQGKDDGSFRALLKVAAVSWSLLTKNEKFSFSIRILIRFALNGLDIVAVGLMGVLGALTATGLSGQRIEILGYQLPSPTPSNVITLVILVAVLFFIRGGLAIVFARWTAIFLAGIEVKNTAKITRYLFSGSLKRLKRYSRAEIGFLVGSSTSATFSGVLGSITTLVIEGTMFLSIFAVFLLVDWVAALGILVYFVLLILIMQLSTARRYLRSGTDMKTGAVDSGNALLEMVDGFREISVLSKQDFYLRRLIEAMKLQARTGVNLQILKALPAHIAQGGLILGALGFVLWQLNRGSLSEGLIALGVFLAGSFRMMGALLPLQSLWNDLRVMQDWVLMAQEILVKLRDTPEILDANIFSSTELAVEEVSLDRPTAGLEVVIQNVSFTHEGSGEETISQVSLAVPSGSFVAIVGPSGAGKTTLVDLLLGLYRPDSGKVLLSGHDPLYLRKAIPGLISYVPQKPGLVSGTIAQNIALGVADSDIDSDEVWSVLEKAQLADVVRSIPLGIHSSLGNHSDALSGGQIQRLGLARALYTKPRLLILDEATSALDASTEASVADEIRRLGSETTVIVIAHRLSTVQKADAVHVMETGKVIASGSFSEVRRNVPLIEEYVKLMSFDDD
jgi:ABC-type multidrug transport system fused ATPase/permease subunit